MNQNRNQLARLILARLVAANVRITNASHESLKASKREVELFTARSVPLKMECTEREHVCRHFARRDEQSIALVFVAVAVETIVEKDAHFAQPR